MTTATPARRRRAAAPAPAETETVTEQVPAPTPPILDIKTILVTPEMATRWLAKNAEDQRNLRPTKVESYARDIRAGRWQLTGDSIKFTADGTLIDGQHRLTAVQAAGVSAYMVVAVNVSPAAMPVIDTGIARIFADTLRGLPIANKNLVAACVRRITVWDRGNRMGKGGAAINPTHQELNEVFQSDPEGFVAAAARGNDLQKAKIASGGAGAAAFYLFHRISPEQAHQFFDQLITGANLPPKAPILMVRERLIRARRPGARNEKLDVAEQTALLIRGWNAFREQRELGKTQIVKEGGLNNTNFPLPV